MNMKENVKGLEIFNSLKSANWYTAFRTYGNDHSTLIGLIVNWWISVNPEDNWALEAGPTNKLKKKGERGQCDALLCSGSDAVGILEVEGSRYEFVIKKIETFFDGNNNKIKSLRFALLLFYPVTPLGKKGNRNFPNPLPPQFIKNIREVSSRHRDKSIVLIAIEKKYDRTIAGIRAMNEYYMGSPCKISIRLYEKGKEVLCSYIDKTN